MSSSTNQNSSCCLQYTSQRQQNAVSDSEAEIAQVSQKRGYLWDNGASTMQRRTWLLHCTFPSVIALFLGCQRKLFPPTPTWWLRLCSGLLYISTPLNFFSIGALGLPMRGMSNNTPQLNRSLSQGTQLPSHVTPTTGVPTMSLHTPPSPSRYLLIANVSAIVSFCRALIKCSAYCASATLVWLNKNI